MIRRARQAPALEPFAVTRRAGPAPTPRHRRRDKSCSAAQARRPDTVGFHLLIGQSSPITILIADIRHEFVAKMARRQGRTGIISGCVATDHCCTCSRRRGARRDLLTGFAYRIARRVLAMSWHEALAVLGSAAALSMMILV